MRLVPIRSPRAIALATLLALLIPAGSFATLLVGHPYAMFYNREVGTPNFDTGIVYMWNGMTYAGAATLPNMATGGFFAAGTWETLRDAMYARKFTLVWTNANPSDACPAFCNDGSTGVLQAFVVTIF